MTIIDPNKDEAIEEYLERTFGAHFASLDAAVGSKLGHLANVVHAMGLTLTAAVLQQKGSNAPVGDAIRIFDLVMKREREALEAQKEADDVETPAH